MTKTCITDIQAVVLCGPGHRLVPLVDEEKLPKCLLPIANKPMLHYPLTWLYQSGITDVIVVAHSAGAHRLQSYLSRGIEGGHKPDLVLLDEYEGTFHALMAIKDRLVHDFIVVGCDLITDMPICRLIERIRMGNARMLAVLGTPLTATFGQQPKESTEPKHRLSDEHGLLLGLDKSNRHILSWMAKDDIDGDALTVSMPLLFQYPQMKMRMDLQDVHCYAFRRSVLDDERVMRKGLFSLREDMIPRVIKKQLSSPAESYSCEAIIIDSGYCLRVNTLSAFAECSKQLTRINGAAQMRLISQAAEISAKAQVGNDSMIGDHSRVGDKSSVKRSIVGNHVIIGNNVKISNSIILDYATIEDGNKIEGCIIGWKAIIKDKCFLKDCDVAGEHLVERETQQKGEVLGASRDLYLDEEGDAMSP